MIEVFDSEQFYILVMEYITGGELFDAIVERQRYSEKDALGMVLQIFQGIQYLHKNNIVHRDLKPENLLLSSKGEDAILKLADFGLARRLEPDSPTILESIGTPGYMAPETLALARAPGSAPGISLPVDVWALGVIFFITLCGSPPFIGWDDEETNRMIECAEYAFLPPFWTPVSEEAKDLITHLLVLNPNERYTIEQALEHPWLQKAHSYVTPLPDTQEELKKFQARKKFKGAIHAVKAMNKILNIGKMVTKANPNPKSVTQGPPISASGHPIYSLQELTKNPPKDIDPKCLESYLSDEEFKKVFGIDRPTFNALPGWKQAQRKKAVKLW